MVPKIVVGRCPVRPRSQVSSRQNGLSQLWFKIDGHFVETRRACEKIRSRPRWFSEVDFTELQYSIEDMAIDFAELQKTWFWTIIGPSFWLASAMNGTLLHTLRLCFFTAVNHRFCCFHHQACHSGTSVLVRFYFLCLQSSIVFWADALECDACPHLRTSGSFQLGCFFMQFFPSFLLHNF